MLMDQTTALALTLAAELLVVIAWSRRGIDGAWPRLVAAVLLRLVLRIAWREALLLALVANAASFAVGALLAQAGEGLQRRDA
jgi:hypothetical protein